MNLSKNQIERVTEEIYNKLRLQTSYYEINNASPMDNWYQLSNIRKQEWLYAVGSTLERL